MKVTFKINYHTEWGQNMYVCGSCDALGRNNTTDAYPMNYTENGNWEVEVELKNTKEFAYFYVIKNGSEDNIFQEFGKDREVEVPKNIDALLIEDAWKSHRDEENALFSQAFAGNLFKRTNAKKASSVKNANCRLQLIAPRIGQNQSFCILGSCAALGNWNPDKAVVMKGTKYPCWQADISLSEGVQGFEYKYGIYDHDKKELVAWEYGENRHFFHGKEDFSIKTDLNFRNPDGHWKAAGVAFPVFSLRSESSYGVGEFMDLKLLIDWAVKTGLKIVQILPINDTIATHTWTDSYPYAAISVFALHPMYLNLQKMGALKSAKEMQKISKGGQALNELQQIDYEAVMQLKSPFFKKAYDEQKKDFLKDQGFKDFFENNKSWLVPYAAFSRLRDLYKTPDFTQWGEFSDYNKTKIEALADPKSMDFDDFAVHYFIQYHLHLQLQEVADYAREKGVVLKGDIPIGIYRNSVDAWTNPKLYNMDKQAGAPPDAYAVAGQNWGFPTYNWEEMAKDGFTWWRQRLSAMATYFDAYRIDHILGFFRIWEIPRDSVEGLMGQFNPAIPMFKYELDAFGLYFDHDRYCRPYIREYMLSELFGDDAAEVKDSYLHKGEGDFYYLKDEFDTQRKVEDHLDNELKKGENASKIHKIKHGLFTLLGNVLLFEDAKNHGYHPKIGLHSTYSFRELDENAKHALDKIYIHYYYERQEGFWKEKAMVKLPAIINATDMLVCGEDLGMVPACVPGVMDELGLLNLEIQRMPKRSGSEFGNPAHSDYLSVVSPSCHDMSTIRGWWEEDREQTQRFYNTALRHEGDAPQFCEPWICKEMIQQHLDARAMWAIFPIQDLVAMDAEMRLEDPNAERINVPANPKHYWRYRFHLTMEEMLQADDFSNMLHGLVELSGRDGED